MSDLLHLSRVSYRDQGFSDQGTKNSLKTVYFGNSCVQPQIKGYRQMKLVYSQREKILSLIKGISWKKRLWTHRVK